MNGSDNDIFSPEECKFGILGTHLALCLIEVILNCLVLFIIARSSELHRPTGLVLANMSLSYLVIGLASLMASLPGWFPELGCGIYYQVCSRAFVVGRFNSNFSISMLHIDRLVAIVKPFSYVKLITSKRIRVASTVSWLVSIVLTLTIFHLTLIETKSDIFGCRNMFFAKSRFCFFGLGAIAIGTVVVSYGYIIHLRTTLAPAMKQNVFSTTVSRDKLFPVRRRFVPFIMIITYLAFNFPLTLALIMSDGIPSVDGGRSNRLFELAFKTVDNFALIINLIIFTSTYRTFRKATLRVFFRSLYRKRLVAKFIPSLDQQKAGKLKTLNVEVCSTDQCPP